MKKKIIVIGLITATLCLAGCQKKDPLPIPEYPLDEQAVLEAAKQCDFPEEWTIVENEMRQTDDLIASSYSLKAVNTEVYAGHKVGVTSFLQGEDRVVRVNVTSLDNTEEISKEEFERSLEFIARLFGGFSDESVIADAFLPMFQIAEALTCEQDIEGVTCTIDYNPQKDAGKLLIAISDNKDLLYPQWPDLGIELSAKNVTSTGLTLVVDFEGGEDEWEMGMGPFQLEMLEDGEWKAVPFLENVGYVDNRLKPVPRNTSTEFEESWEKVYGSLDAGKYRMNRFFTEIRNNLDEDNRLAAAPYSVEFEIK